MSRGLRRRLDPARLRRVLGALFLALAVPSAVLIVQTQRQLQFEAFRQYREQAIEFAGRIDARLQQLIAREDARAIDDYRFATPVAGGAQRSPLSAWPIDSDIPGLIGWFQVDARGHYSTPLLSDDPRAQAALPAPERQARRAIAEQLLDVLGRNRLAERRRVDGELADAQTDAAGRTGLAEAEPLDRRDMRAGNSAPAPAQQAFDELRQKSAERSMTRAPPPAMVAAKPAPAREQALADLAPAAEAPATEALATPSPQAVTGGARATATSVTMFDSEVDPLEVARLDSGQLVLFRRVWRDGERSVQGALIDTAAFVRGLIGEPFADSTLAPVSDLDLLWQGAPLQHLAGSGRSYLSHSDALRGDLLNRTRLSSPFAGLELVWQVRELPVAPGSSLVGWAGIVLLAVLVAGFAALYRLGLSQIRLAQQQQDFVAAVSHELKTPLTSIRMYGEMLLAGWASEEKKREYYTFIHDEAERLSRLIGNVLQLARLERDALQLDVRPHAVATLADLLRSRVQAGVERAGFAFALTVDADCADRVLQVDADALVQIVINLVDNAIKFSARADCRRIELTIRCAAPSKVEFAVRDFGPGVPAALAKRIFEPFVRGGSELTREAPGTGIGLALVRQLAEAMAGSVEVVAATPGAEFRVRFG